MRSKPKRKRGGGGNTVEKLGNVATLLINLYFNGFEDRRGYRIQRAVIRDLFEMGRVEAGTMEKLIARLREDGFILHPLDRSNPGTAQEWVLDKISRVEALPLADADAIQRAEERSQAISNNEED